jgi:hypothetical protein
MVDGQGKIDGKRSPWGKRARVMFKVKGGSMTLEII